MDYRLSLQVGAVCSPPSSKGRRRAAIREIEEGYGGCSGGYGRRFGGISGEWSSFCIGNKRKEVEERLRKVSWWMS